jgi:hypothetical protein
MEKLKTSMTASSKKSLVVGHDKRNPNKISLVTKSFALPNLATEIVPKLQQQLPFLLEGLGGDTLALGKLSNGTDKEQRNVISNQPSPQTIPMSQNQNQDEVPTAYTQVRIEASELYQNLLYSCMASCEISE